MLDLVSQCIALLDDVVWCPELQLEAMVQDQRAAARIISGSDGIGHVGRIETQNSLTFRTFDADVMNAHSENLSEECPPNTDSCAL